MTGREPELLAKGIAAALAYNYEQDEEAVRLQQLIQSEGLEATIEKVTGLTPDSALTHTIIKQYQLL